MNNLPTFWLFPLVLLCLGASAVLVNAQAIGVTQAGLNLGQTIIQRDSAFWVAYNTCDVDGIRGFFTEDLEFYHDKGGLTEGCDQLVASIETGLCGAGGNRLRRVALDSTVRVYPMADDGAMILGEHLFYVTEPGRAEYLDGRARFMDYWQLTAGQWKMSRVFSYDHGPAVVAVIRPADTTALSVPESGIHADEATRRN